MAGRLIRAQKLVVFNLPWSVGPKELREHFSKFGPLAYVDVKFDKSTGFSRGFGFVEFAKVEDLQKVLNETHHLEGNILNIKRSEE